MSLTHSQLSFVTCESRMGCSKGRGPGRDIFIIIGFVFVKVHRGLVSRVRDC